MHTLTVRLESQVVLIMRMIRDQANNSSHDAHLYSLVVVEWSIRLPDCETMRQKDVHRTFGKSNADDYLDCSKE